jgi:hypothetical protein
MRPRRTRRGLDHFDLYFLMRNLADRPLPGGKQCLSSGLLIRRQTANEISHFRLHPVISQKKILANLIFVDRIDGLAYIEVVAASGEVPHSGATQEGV